MPTKRLFKNKHWKERNFMDFEPIIKHKKKSTLKDKKVAIDGNNSFGREEVNPLFLPKEKKSVSPKLSSSMTETKGYKVVASSPVGKTDFRYKATLTQRVSPEVNLKVQMLRPFLESLNQLDNATFNNLVSVLIDYYADHELIPRQRRAFHQMVDTQLLMLKPK